MRTITNKFVIIILAIILIGCSRTGTNELTSTNTSYMNLSSPAFKNNGHIPSKYTCDGENISPEINWVDPPEGTQSFVLIHDDPDAIPVAGFVWTHWILFNIPANTRSIAENTSSGDQGITSFGKVGYGGPCPPNGEHKYFFKLYALDTTLDLKSPSKSKIEKAMEGHILEQAELAGLYRRTSF